MLSTHKVLLRSAEVLALASALGALAVAAWARYEPATEFPLELSIIVGFALLMLSFLPACVLGGEYARTVRSPHEKYDDELSSAEIAALIRWAPLPYKLAAVGGIAITIIAALVVGEVSWSSSDPFVARDAVGAMLCLAGLYLLSLPILGSAARMPGTYLDNLVHEAPNSV